MADTPASDPAGNEKVGKPKKGGKLDKYKWWIVGGLGVVAVLVFFFVSRSNSAAQGSTTTTSGTSLDPATQAALESALQAQASGMGGGVGATGATGPAGATGPPGPQGKPGTPGKPGKINYGFKPKPEKPGGVKHTQYYTVRPGDTLSGIAGRFSYKGGWTSLYAANRGVIGSNPNVIHPGQRLKV